MGRAAVHSGRIITWEEALALGLRLLPQPRLAQRPTANRRSAPDAEGRYAPPIPGAWNEI